MRSENVDDVVVMDRDKRMYRLGNQPMDLEKDLLNVEKHFVDRLVEVDENND